MGELLSSAKFGHLTLNTLLVDLRDQISVQNKFDTVKIRTEETNLIELITFTFDSLHFEASKRNIKL
jgi:hypothetical protein